MGGAARGVAGSAAQLASRLAVCVLLAAHGGAAGSVLWDGRNADFAELAKWDWAKQNGK